MRQTELYVHKASVEVKHVEVELYAGNACSLFH